MTTSPMNRSSSMALTRSGPVQEREVVLPEAEPVAQEAAERPPRTRHFALAHPYAALAPTVDVALRAVRLEALLSDPYDEGNPYGFHGLREGTGGRGGVQRTAVEAAVRAELVPAAHGGRYTAADDLVRVLRPLFRRDLALGYAHGARALIAALEREEPVPARAGEFAALLGPAALIATTGTVLRAAVRMVAERGRTEPAIRQWRGPLAAAFAELLACESLVAVGLRASALPQGSGRAVRAAVGYVTAQVVGGVLDEVDLVLGECGRPAGSLERLMVAKLATDVSRAGSGPADVSAYQTDVVRELPSLALAFERRADTTGAVLFRLGEAMPARSVPPAPEGDDTLVGVLTGAAARLSTAVAGGEAVTAALARVAGRLVSEQRALHGPCLAAAHAGRADPAVRALADRQAMLLLAGAVLGVQGAAAGRVPFLGGEHWSLLAASRIAARLGIGPGGPAGPAEIEAQQRVWAELDGRDRLGVDCDLYATRVLW
ncbi:hypothetical protein OHS33_38400 (plasmid) [Streptomyces sp. NBC_00536]|uniref:hypothetical protein n=1 Tax=Streptomyces sp. NBC_00536 TaxID=2975769 RepID=UPI002E80C86B|nr:hypothetical protein [Streptomyces sp. NBC_00536]WUC84274.1 hypothetical protein OHS33_38400 [Streptomyces sp. NBC_00536]